MGVENTGNHGGKCNVGFIVKVPERLARRKCVWPQLFELVHVFVERPVAGLKVSAVSPRTVPHPRTKDQGGCRFAVAPTARLLQQIGGQSKQASHEIVNVDHRHRHIRFDLITIGQL